MGKYSHKHSSLGISAEANEALLATRVGVGHDERTRVLEGERRVGKADLMLLEVRCRLGGVLFVPVHGANRMYARTPPSSEDSLSCELTFKLSGRAVSRPGARVRARRRHARLCNPPTPHGPFQRKLGV